MAVSKVLNWSSVPAYIDARVIAVFSRTPISNKIRVITTATLAKISATLAQSDSFICFFYYSTPVSASGHFKTSAQCREYITATSALEQLRDVDSSSVNDFRYGGNRPKPVIASHPIAAE